VAKRIDRVVHELKIAMFCLGAAHLPTLKTVPIRKETEA
jgi:isopentenyl diphosphate isomerase/L-lactate dehydrogenase-like FMN-dependent dehydrogenase